MEGDRKFIYVNYLGLLYIIYLYSRKKKIKSYFAAVIPRLILLLRIRLFPDYARVKRQRALIRFSSWPEFLFSVFPRSA